MLIDFVLKENCFRSNRTLVVKKTRWYGPGDLSASADSLIVSELPL